MKAYYIDIWQHNHTADIDIGIGSIAYVEEWHFDALIIATNRKEAWHLFNAYYTIKAHCTGDIRPRDFKDKEQKSPWNKDGFGLIFMCIAEETDEHSYRVIEPMEDNPLCAIVQHHPYVHSTAQYEFGWGKPIWSLATKSPTVYPTPQPPPDIDVSNIPF